MSSLFESRLVDKWEWGLFIRKKCLHSIESSAKFSVKIQKWRTPLLDQLMLFLSFLGTEDFYTGVMIFFAIITDTRLAYLFLIILNICFYLTTSIKNLLRLPRPPSPPIDVLEDAYDWALPSLHATHSIVSPIYLFIYFSQHYNLTNTDTVMFVICGLSWTVGISFSRIYLGVHNIIDIVAGFILGTFIVISFTAVEDALDMYITDENNAVLILPVVLMLLLSIHPHAGIPTWSFKETACCTGVALGMCLARSYNGKDDVKYYAALMEQAHYADLSFLQTFLIAMTRLSVGVTLILIARKLIKPIMKPLVRMVYDILGLKSYSFSYYIKNFPQVSKHHKMELEKDQEKKLLIEEFPKKKKIITENGKIHLPNGTSNSSNGSPNDVNGVNYIFEKLKISNTTEDMNANLETSKASITEQNSFISFKCLSEKYPNLVNISEIWDVDIPCDIVTYTCMGWVCINICPHLFYFLNLNGV